MSEMAMTKCICKPYVKYLALKVDIFQCEIVDEKNFDPNDKKGIQDFVQKYSRDDFYSIVSIDM